jgi:hypothetical protein
VVGIKTIQECPTQADAYKAESYWVSFVDRLGFKLTNRTPGGKGGPSQLGVTRSVETRLKISQSKKGKKWGHHSPESKNKLSMVCRGKTFSAKHKANLSTARRKRITSTETKLKMSHSSKGKINTKIYSIAAPDGREYITTEGLTKFCEDNKNLGISHASLVRMLRCKRSIKKWSIKEL